MSTSETKRHWQAALKDAEAFRDLFAGCYERWEIAGSTRRKSLTVGDVEHVVIPKWGDVLDETDLFGGKKKENLLWFQLDELVDDGKLSKHVYQVEGKGEQCRWGDSYRGVDFRDFNHEIFCANSQNWGSVLAIRTGPWQFSKGLVTGLLRNGYMNAGGYVRNENSWSCRCGWRGTKSMLVSVDGSVNVRTDGSYGEKPASEIICPLCRKEKAEALIISCPTEEDFFRMAGMRWIPPERRQP